MIRHAIRTMLGLALAGLLLGASGPLFADDHSLLDDLWKRRLYPAAERLCRENLAKTSLSEVEYARWTADLIQSQSQMAANALPVEREALWKAARNTAEEFHRSQRGHPRALLIEMQDALTVLMRAELERLETDALATSADAFEQAKQDLREALNRFERLDKQLTVLVPEARRRKSTSPELSGDELTSLQFHVWAQQVRARRNQALCYRSGSPDRIAALTEAVAAAKKAVSQLPADEPLGIHLRLEQAVCWRLADDLDAARSILDSLQNEQLSATDRMLYEVELVRWQLAAKDWQAAEQQMREARRNAEAITPDCDLAQLEILLAAWTDAAEKQLPALRLREWSRRANRAVDDIEVAHGPYWSRRGERLLLATAKSIGGEQDWEIVRRSADNLYLQGDFDSAVAAYDDAANKAEEGAEPAAAFQLAYKAALVRQQQNQHDEAYQRLKRLVREQDASRLSTTSTINPSSAEASSAHLLAAWNLAQVVRRDPERVSEYQSILEEHVRRFGQEGTSDRARCWLGRLYESQGKPQAAIDVYQGIRADFEEFHDIVRSAANCYQQRLQQTIDDPAAVGATVQRGLAFFDEVHQPFLRQSGDQPAVAWNDAAREAALASAQLRLRFSPRDAKTAETSLRSALVGEPKPEESFREPAALWLGLAIAAQPEREAEAATWLLGENPAELDTSFRLLEDLSRMAETSPAQRASLARLQLKIIEHLGTQRAVATAAQELQIEETRAEALVAIGDLRGATDGLARLAAKHSTDGRIHEKYAQLLSQTNEPAQLTRALDQWRIVAARSARRSARWFRAKYAVAQTLVRLDRQGEAAKLIRYLEATDGLGSEMQQQQFRALLRQCEGADPAGTHG